MQFQNIIQMLRFIVFSTSNCFAWKVVSDKSDLSLQWYWQQESSCPNKGQLHQRLWRRKTDLRVPAGQEEVLVRTTGHWLTEVDPERIIVLLQYILTRTMLRRTVQQQQTSPRNTQTAKQSPRVSPKAPAPVLSFILTVEPLSECQINVSGRWHLISLPSYDRVWTSAWALGTWICDISLCFSQQVDCQLPSAGSAMENSLLAVCDTPSRGLRIPSVLPVRIQKPWAVSPSSSTQTSSNWLEFSWTATPGYLSSSARNVTLSFTNATASW